MATAIFTKPLRINKRMNNMTSAIAVTGINEISDATRYANQHNLVLIAFVDELSVTDSEKEFVELARTNPR